MTNKNIEKFEQLGTETIEEETSDLQKELLTIFSKYPTLYFTQPQFVQELHLSNPFVNKTLRKMCDQKIIMRERRCNKYWYKLAPKRRTSE